MVECGAGQRRDWIIMGGHEDTLFMDMKTNSLILNTLSAVQMMGETPWQSGTDQQCDNYQAWLDGGRHEDRHFSSKHPHRHESDRKLYGKVAHVSSVI